MSKSEINKNTIKVPYPKVLAANGRAMIPEPMMAFDRLKQLEKNPDWAAILFKFYVLQEEALK